jgi:hypothetical protein
VRLELREPFAQRLAGLGCAVHEILALHDLEHGVGSGAGRGVRAERVEHDFVPGLDQRLDHGVRGEDSTHGCVAARQPLASDEDVGCHTEVLDREALAGAPEAGHHLVGDQQHAVPSADLGQPRPVLLRRDQRPAARADDRLGDDGGHRLGPLVSDDSLDLVDAPDAAARVGLPQRAAQAVAGRRLRRLDQERTHHLSARGVAADGQCREGRAVIGDVAGDDLPALGATRRDVVLAGQPQGGIDRLRAAAGVQDARQVLGQPALEQPLGQAQAAVGRERGDDVADASELARDRLGDLGPSLAHVHDDRAARGVENRAPVFREEVGALRALDLQGPPARNEGPDRSLRDGHAGKLPPPGAACQEDGAARPAGWAT